MAVFLEARAVCNGWRILSRSGAETRMEKLPRYVVSTPEGHHLEEFTLFAHAKGWCERHDVQATTRRRAAEERRQYTYWLLEQALEQQTEVRPDEHEALLRKTVEDFIAHHGMSAFVTLQGVYEVLSVVFSGEMSKNTADTSRRG